jgi:hypothetical protein
MSRKYDEMRKITQKVALALGLPKDGYFHYLSKSTVEGGGYPGGSYFYHDTYIVAFFGEKRVVSSGWRGIAIQSRIEGTMPTFVGTKESCGQNCSQNGNECEYDALLFHRDAWTKRLAEEFQRIDAEEKAAIEEGKACL